MTWAVGIDLGGTNVRAAQVDDTGNRMILRKVVIPLSRGPITT
jgi:predicted NBD/HSP70 family sugar kinase